MASSSENGIVHLRSPYPVPELFERLESIVKSKGLMIFSSIDHSGEAEKAGLKMPSTRLLIFGSPKGGTPLMIAAPSLAIDLPLKALAWEDNEGIAWLSYNTPEYLQQRHSIPDSLLPNIAGIRLICEEAVRQTPSA